METANPTFPPRISADVIALDKSKAEVLGALQNTGVTYYSIRTQDFLNSLQSQPPS